MKAQIINAVKRKPVGEVQLTLTAREALILRDIFGGSRASELYKFIKESSNWSKAGSEEANEVSLRVTNVLDTLSEVLSTDYDQSSIK